MVLDPVTILVIHLLIILLVGVSYAVAWLDARRETALLWMFGGTLGAGIGIILRFSVPAPASLILSNGLIEAASCCLWFACRRLREVRVWPWALALPPLLWCGLPAWPLFGAIGPRIVLANLVLALFFLLAAREVLAFARTTPALRLYMIGLLGLQAGVYLVWAMVNLVSPPAAQAHLLTLRGLVLTDLVSLVVTLLLAIGLIGLARDKTLRLYRQAALTDVVTGIENRRAFEERLPMATAGAARHRLALGIIMMDADHFKSYNDRYGHLHGDRCLRRIAQGLKAGLSGVDGSVFRYGGEEFVALVSLPSRDEIAALAESLRQSVRDLRLPHEGQGSGIVTISMGVAMAEPSAGFDPARLLAAADDALYEAKRGGRDRVIILTSDTAPAVVSERETARI
ncbi:GGDEF domain-containing protein [Acidisoma silvae]|uniref:diguanylate cyclase n=1 Tax=Acidisoma silvae TaxID=2802396 RepID=A0A964E098_9PROT|nr:GGDEF domain-containing protein [Acidisoma silvae]MCB8876483.1 GGDEF domain-containing protein [Acidisoma silvae]